MLIIYHQKKIQTNIYECCQGMSESIRDCCQGMSESIRDCCQGMNESIRDCCQGINESIRNCCGRMCEYINSSCQRMYQSIRNCCAGNEEPNEGELFFLVLNFILMFLIVKRAFLRIFSWADTVRGLFNPGLFNSDYSTRTIQL